MTSLTRIIVNILIFCVFIVSLGFFVLYKTVASGIIIAKKFTNDFFNDEIYK